MLPCELRVTAMLLLLLLLPYISSRRLESRQAQVPSVVAWHQAAPAQELLLFTVRGTPSELPVQHVSL